MFGMLKPCAHGAEKYGIDPADWRAHMCGLCLGLRDGHGQLARAATNTDAIVLSVLTEAQLSTPMARTEAGPCPLRGMRRASVAAADSPGVRLASTASLLLGSAKIRDHVDDGDSAVLTRRPMRRMSTTWAESARTQAGLIGLDIEPLFAAIDSQTRLEQHAAEQVRMHSAALAPVGARPGPGAQQGDGRGISTDLTCAADQQRTDGMVLLSLEELTAPTQLCAAELFAHTAVLAERPENVAALREAGGHFGRIAHLADAVEDFDEDRAHGRFNPLAATGTSMPEAYGLIRRSDSLLRQAIARARLDEQSVVRWILLDPLTALLRRLGSGLGLLPAAVHACRTHSTNAAVLQVASPHGALANPPGAHADTQVAHQYPPPQFPPPQFPPPQFPPPSGPPPRRPRRPGVGESLALILGVYCTGYACCADHTSPCTGEQKDAWYKNIENCCDCADCCSNCGDCCNCGGDGCSCCDCGCDCGC